MEAQARAVPQTPAALDESVFFLPVSELAARIRAKRLKPTDLVAGCLDRLERLGPKYNAVATLMREPAMDEARRGRTRAGARPGPRAAPRHPLWREGPARHEGRAHHLGRRAVPGPGLRLRRDRGAQAARGGRGAGRQARDGRAGGRHGLQPRERLVHRAGPHAVEHEVLERRLLERPRRRRGGGPGALRHRLGDLGLDPHARGLLRRDGPAADLRARQPARRDGAVLDARQARTAGAHRRRLRARARGHGGARPARRERARARLRPRAARAARRCAEAAAGRAEGRDREGAAGGARELRGGAARRSAATSS